MRTNKDRQLLKHILDYCDQVKEAADRIETAENLLSDQFSRNALAMPLAQIGELVRILSDEFKNRRDDIPWAAIRGLRNHLIHDYGQTDWNRVWDTAINDIPEFKSKCMEIEIELEKLETKE